MVGDVVGREGIRKVAGRFFNACKEAFGQRTDKRGEGEGCWTYFVDNLWRRLDQGFASCGGDLLQCLSYQCLCVENVVLSGSGRRRRDPAKSVQGRLVGDLSA